MVSVYVPALPQSVQSPDAATSAWVNVVPYLPSRTLVGEAADADAVAGGPVVHPRFLCGHFTDPVDSQGGLRVAGQVRVGGGFGVVQGFELALGCRKRLGALPAHRGPVHPVRGAAGLAGRGLYGGLPQPAGIGRGQPASTAEETASVVVLANSGALTSTYGATCR